MQSRRSSRESNKKRASRKNKNVPNEIEDMSSQSYVDDSGDYSRRSHKARRSSHSSKKEQSRDDETEDYFSDIRGRRETSNNKKKGKSSGSKEKEDEDESTEDVLTDEEYADKNKSTAERKKARKRRKSTRTNGSNSHESAGERDSSSKKSSAKGKRKKQQQPEESDKPSELPITEILKKAQQQRTKYEDPTPLAELTASTVYVQDRNGFSAIKIPGKHPNASSNAMTPSSGGRPIEVAIVFQKIWRSSGFIFQGILGGMALLHLIFMNTYFKNTDEFMSSYSQLVEVYGSCYSFLIAMCLISVLDKFDLAHIGKRHFRQIFQYHLKSVLALPLYIAAFFLHQVTLKVDDKLTLLRYASSNLTYYSYNDINFTSGEIGVTELKTWQRITFSKDVLAVLGWIFASIGNREDMLLEHLETMSKHPEDVN